MYLKNAYRKRILPSKMSTGKEKCIPKMRTGKEKCIPKMRTGKENDSQILVPKQNCVYLSLLIVKGVTKVTRVNSTILPKVPQLNSCDFIKIFCG